MTTGGAQSWKLERFPERLNSWITVCDPSSELRRTVRQWVMTRYDDPYAGMAQQEGFPNLWYGRIPSTDDGCGNSVVCSYWIDAQTRTVTCNDFTTLSRPT